MDYTDDELRRFLGMWVDDATLLSSDQVKALIAWEQTPETTRVRLEVALAARLESPPAASVTSLEREHLDSEDG